MDDSLTLTIDTAQLQRTLENVVNVLGAGPGQSSELLIRFLFGGPAAGYAVYVHENLEAHHQVGEAEFVKRVLLEHEPHLAQELADRLGQGLTLRQSMREIAELYMTEMKERTPVDTGALRDSGHIEGP